MISTPNTPLFERMETMDPKMARAQDGRPMTRLAVSTAFAAQVLGVAPATIRDWKRRGLVTPKGRNRWDLVELRRAQQADKPRRKIVPDSTTDPAGPHNGPIFALPGNSGP